MLISVVLVLLSLGIVLKPQFLASHTPTKFYPVVCTTESEMTVVVRSLHSCKILSYIISNCCAEFLCLINLQIHESFCQAGHPGLCFILSLQQTHILFLMQCYFRSQRLLTEIQIISANCRCINCRGKKSGGWRTGGKTQPLYNIQISF